MTTRITLAAAAVVLSASATANAILLTPEVVYREVFPNSTSQNNTATVGWQAHEGPTATQIGGIAVGDTVHLATGGAPNPNPTPINSGPDSIGQGRTFHGGTAGQAQIFWTDEFTIPANLRVTSVTWFESHSSGGGPLSFVARVSGEGWFLTDLTASPTGNSEPGGWDQQEIDLLATTWQPITFTPGSVLLLDGAVGGDLPGGSVTAFGALERSFTNFLRLDTFEIMAARIVPEPSAMSLLAVALPLIWRKSRRHSLRKRS